MMSLFASVALVFLCRLSIASSAGISPELEPKSSKKFFNKDYPADHHPVADEHYYFNHPYPAVQDSGDFDKDFVQDENSDGGKWQAQMDYDLLRQKVRQAEKELAKLKKKLEAEAAEMRAAEKEWKQAVEKVRIAKAATEKARNAEAAEASDVKSNEDRVHSAESKVEKEMKDLEACKKKLEDSRRRLKDLQDKKKALKEKAEADRQAAMTEDQRQKEKKVKEEKDREQHKKEHDEEVKKEKQRKSDEEARAKEAAEKKAAEEYKKQLSKHEDKMDAYNRKVAEIKRQQKEMEKKKAAQKQALAEAIKDKSKKDAAWQDKISKEKSEYVVAWREYDQVMAEVHATQFQLEMAAMELKKFRRPPHVDDDGGVYNVPKSSAFSVHASALLVASLLSLLLW